MTERKDLQQVWRTVSSTRDSYFVWDVLELIGEPFKESYFVKCRDDSFVSIQAYHFWTKEKADEFVTQSWEDWQKVILITDPAKTYAIESTVHEEMEYEPPSDYMIG